MATDVNGQAPSSGSTMPMPSLPPGTYRPAAPDHGPGRWFRACAGIREEVMDWTPSERLKYAGLGIIVLNTGCLAAFAMFIALHTIISAPAVALLLPALVWGWIIFSVDRWLITSTHGIQGMNRVLVFTPRIILAVLVAFTIAEPLTLRIFQNTLDSTVATSRTAQLDAYESKLQTCNPVSGLWVGSASCNGYHLSVADSPYAAQQKLVAARQQQAQLKSTVSSEETREHQLITTAQGECAGTAGADMSGQAGQGPRCKADWAAVSAYDKQSGLAVKQKQLAALQASIAGMIGQTGNAQQVYAAKLHGAITTAVSEKRKDLETQIGMIDEWKALEQLSSQNTFVFFGHWLLVLILIALDCLPVLAKLMSGSSAYDRLLSEQRAADERVYALGVRFREEEMSVGNEIGIYEAKVKKRSRMREIDREERVKNAQGINDGFDVVRTLAARWIDEAEEGGT